MKTSILEESPGKFRFSFTAAVIALVAVAIATVGFTTGMAKAETTHQEDEELTAVDLRVKINLLLQEHVYLTLDATEEIIEGDSMDEFYQAMITLDKRNTIPLSDLIGSVYGDETREAFFNLWRNHIGFFFDYAHAVEAGDQQAKVIALNELDQYTVEVGELLGGANPNLDSEGVTTLFQFHVVTMIAAIEAQGDEIEFNEYEAAWASAATVQPGADALASAIVAQFPDTFAGPIDENGADPNSVSESDLRVVFNLTLQEHAYMTLGATEEIVEEESMDEFYQAMWTLDKRNTVPFAILVASVYGEDAGEAFLQLWRNHIGYFFDYAHAVEEGDHEAMEIARNELEQYTMDAGAFFGDANPDITADAVQMWLMGHVEAMLATIDAQGSGPDEGGDMNQYYRAWKAATHVMGGADALSGAIATQFPDVFVSAEESEE